MYWRGPSLPLSLPFCQQPSSFSWVGRELRNQAPTWRLVHATILQPSFSLSSLGAFLFTVSLFWSSCLNYSSLFPPLRLCVFASSVIPTQHPFPLSTPLQLSVLSMELFLLLLLRMPASHRHSVQCSLPMLLLAPPPLPSVTSVFPLLRLSFRLLTQPVSHLLPHTCILHAPLPWSFSLSAFALSSHSVPHLPCSCALCKSSRYTQEKIRFSYNKHSLST